MLSLTSFERCFVRGRSGILKLGFALNGEIAHDDRD
jgi:hypothetical protein